MSTEITAVEIEGFRAIRSALRLEMTDAFGRPLRRAVLAGPNGAGKTSALEAMLLALGREELIVRDLPAAKRGDHWRVELPPGARVRIHFRTESLKSILGFDAKSFHVTRTASEWTIHDDTGALVEADPAAVRERLRAIEVEYFSSWRAPILPGGLQATTSGRAPMDNEANRLWRFKQRIINERARRSIARDAAQTHAQDVDWLRRLNVVWRALHRDASTIDADIVDPESEDAMFDLFLFDGSRRRCSIDQVSSGELELVTIAGTLLLASFTGILLIDEPELHLHREWQTGLLDALTAMAPESQIIIATHADAPWDQVLSHERFFLAPPGDPRAATGDS